MRHDQPRRRLTASVPMAGKNTADKKVAAHCCAAKFREETSKKAKRQGRSAATQHKGFGKILQEYFYQHEAFFVMAPKNRHSCESAATIYSSL
jgi:hypothetical protein